MWEAGLSGRGQGPGGGAVWEAGRVGGGAVWGRGRVGAGPSGGGAEWGAETGSTIPVDSPSGHGGGTAASGWCL